MVYRPPFIKQLDGSTYGGQNCTMASACMAAVRHQRGVNPPGVAPWYPRPKDLRYWLQDKSGGTTLAQADYVLNQKYGINLTVAYNLSYGTFRGRIMNGQGAILQGGYAPIRRTKYSGSPTFSGNHAVYVNEIRWNETYDRWEYLWYDPLCDGRRSGIAKGPQWIPESLLRAFANALMLAPGARIQSGKVYAAFTRDTEPVILKYGAKAYRAHLRVRNNSRARVRRTPTTRGYVVATLGENAPFEAYQRKTDGPLSNGSRHWYGDQNGVRWVPHGSMRRV